MKTIEQTKLDIKARRTRAEERSVNRRIMVVAEALEELEAQYELWRKAHPAAAFLGGNAQFEATKSALLKRLGALFQETK